MADNQVSEKVLKIVKEHGPVIPTEISREIGTNSILASAILSELVSNKHLRISHVKMGGTPFYYAPGQEEKLQNYTKYLHEKEKKAYDLLKEHKVIRDSIQEPVIRVALRNIKDFALPLNVQAGSEVELFWKWYMISNEEAEPLIKKSLGIEEPAQEKHVQQTLEKPSERPAPRKAKESGEFIAQIMNYFTHNKIEVIEKLPSSKKTEAEFIISVPSTVGSVKYYCKAKDKKSCNDGDLSAAFVQGETKKLPVLFLTTGKLTKKANEMLGREFSNMNVKSL